MQRIAVLMAALAVCAGVAFAHPSERRAWQYSDEERIAMRTNPELARERVRVADRGRVRSQQASPVADRFDGSTHPELFLPHEVFRSLISLAFLRPADPAARFRQALLPDVARLDLPADFWERLRVVSTIYVADTSRAQAIGASIRAQTGGARERAQEDLALRSQEECRSRADALAAARKEFGRETFDRFLYEVIAVNKFHTEDELPTPEILLRVERGCR